MTFPESILTQFRQARAWATRQWQSTDNFLEVAAPALTALNNMLADFVYTGYVIDKGHISWPLLVLIWTVRFPGSMILIANNKKATEYIDQHRNALSWAVGNVQKLAQAGISQVEKRLPDIVRRNSLNSFSTAFSGYTIVGVGTAWNGLDKLLADPHWEVNLRELALDIMARNWSKALANPSVPAFFQVLAGSSVTLGCSSYTVSGLEWVKKREKLHKAFTLAGQFISWPTAVLNGTNSYIAGGIYSIRGALLAGMTFLNCAQIVVRRYLHSKIDDDPKSPETGTPVVSTATKLTINAPQ